MNSQNKHRATTSQESVVQQEERDREEEFYQPRAHRAKKKEAKQTPIQEHPSDREEDAGMEEPSKPREVDSPVFIKEQQSTSSVVRAGEKEKQQAQSEVERKQSLQEASQGDNYQASQGGGSIQEEPAKKRGKPAEPRSDSVTRMQEVNNRLKAELFEVVNKMNQQVSKFKAKRVQKAEQLKEINSKLSDKNNKLSRRQLKQKVLKREVDSMWAQLENQFNVSLVTKLEDELVQKTRQTHQLQEETESMHIVEGRQKQAMRALRHEQGEQEKMSSLNAALRQMKTEHKQLKEAGRQQDTVVKQQHEHIVRLEERNKKHMRMVKDVKDGKVKVEQSSEQVQEQLQRA